MHTYTLLEKFLFFPRCRLNPAALHETVRGKTILITGASSGIGEKTAYVLAEAPVHLILVARRGEKLLAMQKEMNGKPAHVSVFRADLRNKEEMEGLLAFLHGLPGGLDLVVSNAGLSIRRSIGDSLGRYHDFTRTMAINYFAPVQLLLSVIPMLEQNKGHVIHVSTINALLLPVPHWAAYQASKSAFDTWFRSASPELNAMGISTTSIYLPLVKTPMIEPTAAYQNMPAMSADHVAAIICRAIYTKGTKYAPWWLPFGQWASILFRSSAEWILPRLLRKKRYRP